VKGKPLNEVVKCRRRVQVKGKTHSWRANSNSKTAPCVVDVGWSHSSMVANHILLLSQKITKFNPNPKPFSNSHMPNINVPTPTPPLS